MIQELYNKTKQWLLVLTCLISFTSNAQQHFFIGAQLEAGTFFKSYEMNRDVLFNSFPTSIFNPKLSFQYRLRNFISLEAGLGAKRLGWSLRDRSFESRNEGFEVQVNNSASFFNFFTNLQFAFKIDPKFYWYVQTGFNYDAIGSESLSQTRDIEITRQFTQSNEEVTISSTYANENYSIIPEAGLQWLDINGNIFSVGLAYNQSLGGVIQTLDYTVTDLSDGSTIDTDGATVEGNYLALNFRYNHLLHYTPKKERPPKVKKHKDSILDPIVVDTVVEQPDTLVHQNDKINGRDIVRTHKIRVSSPNLTIKLYDHQIVDGDIVSLILNDEWVIENYSLTKQKHSIQITVPEGNSDLILYALNLGKFSPNTAAIVIDDGVKEQQIILESDLEESGTLEIKYKPKK